MNNEKKTTTENEKEKEKKIDKGDKQFINKITTTIKTHDRFENLCCARLGFMIADLRYSIYLFHENKSV